MLYVKVNVNVNVYQIRSAMPWMFASPLSLSLSPSLSPSLPPSLSVSLSCPDVSLYPQHEVRDVVLGISIMDTKQHWDLRAAATSMNQGPLASHVFDKLDLPPRFAIALLKRDPNLAELRFRMVPSRIKEDVFWKQYFEQIITRIIAYVQRGSHTSQPVVRDPDTLQTGSFIK
jgi:BSD domain